MTAHDNEAQQHKARTWQVYQRGEGDHAQANRPDHLQPQGWRYQGCVPGKIHQRQLQKYQEHAAFEQVGGDFFAAMGLPVKPGRETGQEYKYRCADHAADPRKEQFRRRIERVHGIANLRMQKESLTHVINQHEQHDQPAQGINRQHARAHLSLGVSVYKWTGMVRLGGWVGHVGKFLEAIDRKGYIITIKNETIVTQSPL